MEEKEFYTQTEISNALGKSLSSLAFYKAELQEKGYMVEQEGRNMITKEGFDYLKLRFAEKVQKTNSSNSKEEKVKVNVQEKEKEQKEKVSQNKINEKDLEIERLKALNASLQDKNTYLNTQVTKWESECKAWQENASIANEDKKFWQSFATSEINNLKDTLLPVVMPTKQKQKKKFSLFGKK